MKNKNSFTYKIIFIFIVNIIYIYITGKVYSKNTNNILERCYLPPNDSNLKIIHFIITRFIIEYWPFNEFPNKIYKEDYIRNGIRVMKKYLFPSLENQSCRNFIWVLMLGDKAKIDFIKSLLDFDKSFNIIVIYKKDIKEYIRNTTKGYDILITSRIDYDDRIYYDAINDVRKAININKPMILYGYNSGVHYYEFDNKYYEFNISYKNEGVMSIFISLITMLNKVNDTYIIYDLGSHIQVKSRLLNSYKSFGIKELDYDPAIFDSGIEKFVWVRQSHSGLYDFSKSIENNLKEYKFNLSKFYGK